jgi:pimeloyl-ACP methyl ester carboxylesterase
LGRVTATFAVALALVVIAPKTAVADMAETEIQAPGPLGPLKGATLSPGIEGAPIVLIIPGSGPVNRDGDSPQGLKAATYKLLAEGLAARGIASVRIDKRGLFTSAKAIRDPNAVTIADYAADVHAWIAAIRERTTAKCVWVLGHSEGGLVALVAAQEKPDDICGLLLVATPGRKMGDVIRDQLRANPANRPILYEAMRDLDDLEAGQRVDASTMNPLLLPLMRAQVQGFLISEFSYDPAALIARIEKPVLILQGARDLQVSEADARRLQEAGRKAILVILPDTNHVLKAVASDDRAANIATYQQGDLPLAPGVADAIAAFIVARPASN